MRRRDLVSAIIVGIAVGVAIFAVGGAFRWAQAAVAALVAIALVPQLLSRRIPARRSPLTVALGIAALLTAISLIPLPGGLRELVDPVGTALREDGAALLDLAPWPGWTRDAAGSIRGLVFFLILLGVAVIAVRIAVSERGRYALLSAVAGLCGLTAIVVGLHELFGATRLYGIYQMHATPNILGPLLNENHLGGLMAVGTCVAIGLVMHRRQRSAMRVVWMLVVMMCGAATVASHSRGATLALPAGALIVAGILVGQRFAAPELPARRRRKFATSSLPIAVVAICVVVVVVYSSSGRVSEELGRTSLTEEIHKSRSKFAAWKSSEDLIEESPWIGVGRGGFESSFTRFYPASGEVAFSHVENEYLQAVVDWGIPGALLLGFAAVWWASVALRRWRDGALAAGAIGGLCAIALQSSVDFGVELLGLALPVTVVAATLSYVPLRETSGRILTGARALRAGHVLALLGGVALLLSHCTTTIEEDHDALAGQPAVAMTDVQAALDRHPLDYYGYAVAAELSIRSQDPRAVRLLNHAMRLHPTLPDLHRIAARMLYRSGHIDQATLEYASALRSTAEPQHLLGEIVEAFTPAQAAEAIPPDVANEDIVLKALRDLQHEDIAAIWLARVLVVHPRDVHTCNLLYEVSLSRGDLGAAETAGRSCVELMPDHKTRLSLAHVLFGKKGYGEVIQLLRDIDTWQGRIDENVEGWLTLCDAYSGLARWDDAALCLHRLDATGSIPLGQRGDISKRLDDLDAKRRASDLKSGSGRGSAAPLPPSP